MIELVVSQTNLSQTPDVSQVPASAVKNPVKTQTTWTRSTGLEGTAAIARAPTQTNWERGFMQPDVRPSLDVEEYFEAVVEQFTLDSVQFRMTSSEGEDGVSWVPMEKIPTSEQKYVALGAPARISIVVHRGLGTNRRESEIRFLRPSQWRHSVESEAAADFLLERMKAVLR